MTETPVAAPTPDSYLPPLQLTDHPELVAELDAEPDIAASAAAFLATPLSPRDWTEALAWCLGQSTHRDKNWAGRCQEFCHDAWAIGSGQPSALAQWHAIPAELRTVGGAPEDAPIGANLFSQSRDPGALAFRFGHIITKRRPFTDHSTAAWSTDAVRIGWPDPVNPTVLYERWNHVYLGWGHQLNGVTTRVKDVKPPAPPAPVQNQKYLALAGAAARLGNAIDSLRVARNTARDHHDDKDVARLQAQIDAAKKLKAHLNRLADHLRHA